MHEVHTALARNSQPVAKRRAPGSVTNRSAVSNGNRLLEGIDGRSTTARRFRDLCKTYELEAGGPITEVERGLIRQAAGLSVHAERLQADVVNGKTVNADEMIRTTSEIRRILETIRTQGCEAQGWPEADHPRASDGR